MNSNSRISAIESGNDFKVYEYLGSHLGTKKKKSGTHFRVYAPHAKQIFVMGDFNDWNETSLPLKRIENSNIWEIFVEKSKEFQKYQYIIVDEFDKKHYKSDPYANYGKVYGNDDDFSSIIYNLKGYHWHDSKYIEEKNQVNHLSSPINIYEVCLLTWKKHSNGKFYTYKELASSLIPYCKKMGYTHIELLPITEYPFDISWGYQVTGYFAATSRFGKPKDLMYFVDKCHEAGLGVILDWVPAHFETDDFGLKDFDGKSLYESYKWDRKEQLAWGTRIFDYEKPYVTQFLISSALFFLRNFHFDGIRVDAVVAILYLDFARSADEWIPNSSGGNVNFAGVEFLKKLNNTIFSEFPNALMIAEEVSGWPMTTKPTSMGGLGFNFKWNVGWINDIWEYTSMDPYFRKYHHNIMTHTFDYCFDENYILPIDHDEVGNGRHSLINKMNGEMQTKIDLCRAFFAYMFMHPGKKLTFMGSEFGQLNEWSFKDPINFNLLKFDRHKKLNKFVMALNHLYLETPELYEIDFSKSGFEWIVKDDSEHCVTIFKRKSNSGNYVICVCNFSPYRIHDYVFGLDEAGCYEEFFSSNSEEYGGTGESNGKVYSLIMNKDGKTNALRIKIPANTTLYFRKV